MGSRARRGGVRPNRTIQGLLKHVRGQLGLDVAVVGEITRGKHTIRFVDGDAESFGFNVGDEVPADATYCQRVIDGVMHGVVRDARNDPYTANLAPTGRANIGCYIGFPIVLPSGRVYGALCAFGHSPSRELDARDLGFMRVVAEMIGEHLGTQAFLADSERQRKRMRIEEILADPGLPRIALQPVIDLARGGVVAFEALSRFRRSRPEPTFSDAWEVGLGEALELQAVEHALLAIERIPGDVSLSINVSPRTVISDAFRELVSSVQPKRLIVEVTEHDAIKNYSEVKEAFDGVLDRGVRLAIDDVGAGYSSLVHIMELSPDILKLDTVFTRGIDADPVRRSLASALVMFGRSIDAVVLAEGVETSQELSTMRRLGIDQGQGFFIGRPMSAAALA